MLIFLTFAYNSLMNLSQDHKFTNQLLYKQFLTSRVQVFLLKP